MALVKEKTAMRGTKSLLGVLQEAINRETKMDPVWVTGSAGGRADNDMG